MSQQLGDKEDPGGASGGWFYLEGIKGLQVEWGVGKHSIFYVTYSGSV